MGVLTAIGTGLAAIGGGSALAGAAVVGGVASGVGGALSARANAKAQEKARKAQIKGIQDLSRVRNDLQSEALAGTFLDRFSNEDVFGRKPTELDLGQSIRNGIRENAQNLSASADFASQANQAISEESIRRAQQFDPNFRENIRSLSAQARSLIEGEIPDDVLGEITRNRAQLNAGFGVPGSQRQATARDLGLTSLDLQGRGASLFTNINSIRDTVDPLSRQIGLNQLQITPQQQIEQDLANSVLRAAPDPTGSAFFQDTSRGLREEAFARSNISVPVDNTIGAGLSGFGGLVSGLTGSGLFGGK